MEPRLILAADIGGTKVALGVFEELGQDLHLLREAEFASKQYREFEQMLMEFLTEQPKRSLHAGCFAVAGPVFDGRCRITNLSWTLEETTLAQAIGAPRVKLLNDVQAAAYGMLYLPPSDLSILNGGAGRARRGNMAVVSVGTGLGESMLYWDGTQHHPIASEGGHTDFAPRTEQEIALLRHLAAKFGGHVSYERVLSGPGLHSLYTFLRESGHVLEPAWLAEELQHDDPNAVITRVALAGEDPLCVAALDMFATILGSEAGNLALKCLAVGGVFVAGGIAPKILPALQKGSFMRGFADKGRFGELLQRLEVCVALNPRAPLLGAAHFALRL